VQQVSHSGIAFGKLLVGDQLHSINGDRVSGMEQDDLLARYASCLNLHFVVIRPDQARSSRNSRNSLFSRHSTDMQAESPRASISLQASPLHLSPETHSKPPSFMQRFSLTRKSSRGNVESKATQAKESATKDESVACDVYEI
jgi:hypothetical protein